MSLADQGYIAKTMEKVGTYVVAELRRNFKQLSQTKQGSKNLTAGLRQGAVHVVYFSRQSSRDPFQPETTALAMFRSGVVL